jgi:hypothetical protein
MANKTVTINVYSNGDFNYSYALLGVSANDTVTWNTGSDTGNFSITFRTADTPLTTGGLELFGSPGNPIVGTVKTNLPVGTVYRYSVTATNVPSGKTWSDIGCPELIIR